MIARTQKCALRTFQCLLVVEMGGDIHVCLPVCSSGIYISADVKISYDCLLIVFQQLSEHSMGGGPSIARFHDRCDTQSQVHTINVTLTCMFQDLANIHLHVPVIDVTPIWVRSVCCGNFPRLVPNR